MKSKTIKLKRCPFCGGKALIDATPNYWGGLIWNYYRVACKKCGTGFSSEQLKTAVRKWNARKADETEDVYVAVGNAWVQKDSAKNE